MTAKRQRQTKLTPTAPTSTRQLSLTRSQEAFVLDLTKLGSTTEHAGMTEQITGPKRVTKTSIRMPLLTVSIFSVLRGSV